MKYRVHFYENSGIGRVILRGGIFHPAGSQIVSCHAMTTECDSKKDPTYVE